MRLAGQAKMGFYPCPPEVVPLIAAHLEPDTKFPERMRIMDPCAGEGEAIKGIADSLGIPHDRVYCVELSKERGEKIATLMPGCNLLAPASYMGTWVSQHSFGLVYVNPPFDDEIGGGRREEESFLRRAASHLLSGGTVVLVMPFNKLEGNHSLISAIDSTFESVRVYRFPEEHRKFREIAVIGTRRKMDLPADAIQKTGELHLSGWHRYSFDLQIESLPVVGGPWAPIVVTEDRWGSETSSMGEPEPDIAKYKVPWTHPPRAWKKLVMTDEEKADELLSSPLNNLFSETKPKRIERPPMALDKGHVALMLASGMLDGVVHEPDGSSHVVRGTSRKVSYVNQSESKTTINPDTGVVTEKQVISQRIEMIIRAVGQDGVIHNFTDTPPEKPEEATESPDGDPQQDHGPPQESPAYEKAASDLTRASIAQRAELALSPPPEADPLPPRSWKVAVFVRGQEGPSYNGLRFSTEHDAKRHGEDLLSRWMLMTRYEVEPSEDEPNR